MSDSRSYGDPVEEPTPPVDDVVGRAHEGLADAEAARAAAEAERADAEAARADAEADRADAVAAEAAAADADRSDAAPAADRPADDERPSAANEWAAEPPAWAAAATPAAAPAANSYDAPTTAYDTPTTSYDAPTTAYDNTPAPVTPSEPAVVAPAPTPIFVQAPEAPRPRGNRAAAGAIGLLAALAFAVLSLAAWLVFGAVAGEVTTANVGAKALEALATWALWVPVVVFFIAFWLLGAIINRGRWGAWVHFGLLVGFASYGGYLLGQLFQAPFWTLTASQGAQLMQEQVLAPMAIASFIFGRELTIWFGAWVAARGRRVTELNVEAQREYERTLEAGPQLTHA